MGKVHREEPGPSRHIRGLTALPRRLVVHALLSTSTSTTPARGRGRESQRSPLARHGGDHPGVPPRKVAAFSRCVAKSSLKNAMPRRMPPVKNAHEMMSQKKPHMRELPKPTTLANSVASDPFTLRLSVSSMTSHCVCVSRVGGPRGLCALARCGAPGYSPRCTDSS